MYSFVKNVQRTHNGIFTMHICKQPTLPFSLLKPHAFFFFIWPLYFSLHILPDDLTFDLCVLSSHTVWVLTLFSNKIKLGRETRSWNSYFPLLFYCISSLDHEIHWSLSCYPSLQLSFQASTWISSKLLFIFTSFHEPRAVSIIVLAIFQGLSSLLVFLLLLHSLPWLFHPVLPPPARLPAAQRFMVFVSPITLLPRPIDSSDDIGQSSWVSPSLSRVFGLRHRRLQLSRVCPGNCTSVWGPLLQSRTSDRL